MNYYTGIYGVLQIYKKYLHFIVQVGYIIGLKWILPYILDDYIYSYNSKLVQLRKNNHYNL